MIIVFIAFLLISFFLALKKPIYFVIFYLLASTKFLGFFDVEYYFVIGGVGLGMPMLNITTFIASFFITNWYKVPKKYLKFIIFMLLIIMYGILLPFVRGHETLIQSIMASKDFWAVSILLYLVTHRKKVSIRVLLKTIQFIGFYLALMYVFYLLFNIAPPAYLEGNHVRGYYPTYMSLAFFLYYVSFQNKQIKLKKFIIIGVILFIGLVIAGHFSLVFGTLFALVVISVFYNKTKFSWGRILTRGFTLFSILFIIIISFSDVRKHIVNQYEMIAYGTDVALVSRDIYNEFRWKAIEERPLSGYGFIHKSSPLTSKFRTINENRFAESFGVIDSGYVDLLIKFGYLGTFIYLLLWARVIFPILFRPQKYHILQLGMAAYLMQYFLINYTWSVFTFSHGLIPAFIAIFITQISMKKEKYE